MVPLLILLLALVLIVFPIWALVKILALDQRNQRLERRLAELEREVARAPSPLPPWPAASPAPLPPEPIIESPAPPMPAPPAAVPEFAPLEVNPPPFAPPRVEAPATTPANHEVSSAPPPPGPLPLAPSAFPAAPAPAKPRFNWEQFTGAKLLAWTGGTAAFLGAAFLIKYSFEHDLISPALRVAIGYVFALALVGVGLRIPRQRYSVTAQTLCATGIVCLYAVTFACSSIYDFAFFTPLNTFPLMALITAGAFFLAVRLGARVVAVLGMLGGFLTPVLLSTGRDNPFGLFGYIALLDAGLIALAVHQRWLFLVPLGAAGTVAMELGWAAKFLTAAKTPTAMMVSAVFCVLFLAGCLLARRFLPRAASSSAAGDASRAGGEVPRTLLWPAVALPCVALLSALGFMGYRSVAAQPGLLFGFVLAIDACLLVLAWFERRASGAHLIGGVGTFLLLATWTGLRLTDALLPWALGLYLGHGLLHTTFPLLLARRRPGAAASRWNAAFAPLALALMLAPFFKLDVVPFALWPCVLLVDLLAIGLAVVTGSVLGAIVALVLTLAAAALWLLQLPTGLEPGLLPVLIVGGFAALFFGAGAVLARRHLEAGPGARHPPPASVSLPAFSALMPFVLLVMLTQRLPTPNPSAAFGLALALVAMTFALTYLLQVAWLPACALAGVAALEYAWHLRHFSPAAAATPATWYVVFQAVFLLVPLVARRRFAPMTGPWAAAALSGVIQFPLLYHLIDRTAPNDVMGLIPALFALPPAAAMWAVQRAPAANAQARLNQLAWFGGVTLFFVTLVAPIQFERQWITLGWALEGAALLWLFRRLPHPGLRATGAALLVAAFARLALNPAVLEYHTRSELPIFNWYLYTYGVVSVALFAGAALAGAGSRAFGVAVPALLNSLGTVLAFLLLNLEIADFFSAPGSRVLTFEFSGNFARDMSYTIAWALFGLALLLVGIWKRTRAGRYAALALFGAAVVKLFLHDLERLGALHRIGALFAVAIIAIVASVAYQRFLPGNNDPATKP